MTLLDFDSELERDFNPVDVIEFVADANDWNFERSTDHEITIAVEGTQTDYHVSFSWMDEFEALHLACAFDLKAPEGRADEVTRLLALINGRLWLGHFDFWSEEKAALYRTSLQLAGGAHANPAQCTHMLSSAIEACEQYFQAFQLVTWAGKTAPEAMALAAFETVGEA